LGHFLPGVFHHFQSGVDTITGYGTTTLTAATENPTPTSATSATVVVSETDQATVNEVLNRNGTAASDSVTYNLRAGTAWQPGAAEDATTPITVSNAVE